MYADLFVFDSLSSHCQAVSRQENQTTMDTLGKVSFLKELNNSEATSCGHRTYETKSMTLTASLDMHTFHFKAYFAWPLIQCIWACAKFLRWCQQFFSRFAGNMERQQADNLLKSHSSGTYLIRERTAEAERFAISIKWVFHIMRAGGLRWGSFARGWSQWVLLSTSPGE